MLHHHLARVVKLVVAAVHVREFGPQSDLVAHRDDSRDVDASAKQAEVLHELVRHVVGVQDAELGKDAHVRAIDADASLHERDELGELAANLVVLADGIELVGLNDDVKTASWASLFSSS